MSKAHENKFLYIISVSLMLFLSSCVDTSVQNLEASYDFHSLLKVANIATGSNVQSVTIINNSTNVEEGTLQVGLNTETPAEGQPFMNIPSGSKRFIVHFGGGAPDQLFIQTLDADRKYRVYFFNSDSGVVDILKTDLRYTWQQRGTEEGETLFYPDSAFVGFVNAHTDLAVGFIEIYGPTDTTLVDLHETPLGNGESTGLMLPAPANYNLKLYTADEEEITDLPVTVAGSGRYTSLLYGVRSEIVTKTFTDD
jgi:hypothetical protein